MQKRMSPSEIKDRKRYTIFDVNYLWSVFAHHKKWFALSWLLCLLLAGAYVYFSRPGYNVRGRMVIVEKRTSSAVNAAMMLQNQLPFNLGSSISGNIGVENEKEILKSNLIARDVVNDLGIHTEYLLQKWFKKRLLYKTQPLNVEVSPEMLRFFDEELPLIAHQVNMTIAKHQGGYDVQVRLRANKKKTDLPKQSFTTLPAVIHTDMGDLKLTENALLTSAQKKQYQNKDYTLEVNIVPPMTMARRLSKIVSISSATKKATSTINIDMRDESIMRGIDYVNGLISYYNKYTNEQKHQEVEKSDEFVSMRLAKINAELDTADAKWEQRKKQYQVTEPKVDAEEVMLKKGTYETQLVNFGIQQQLLDFLNEYVSEPANRYELIPVNVGVYAGDAVSLITRHNQLVNERKLLLKSVTEHSTQVKQNAELIDELHPVIETAIQRDKETFALRKKVVEREYNKYMGRVGSVPEQERALTEIGRNRTIKQGVYMTLMQKREENAMELATTTDKGRKTDETVFLKKTKPKTLVAFGLAIGLGFLIPYIVFFLYRQLKRTVDSEVDLKLLTRLPLIGRVSSDPNEYEETFRMIRSNLLHQLKEGQKTVLVTSADEGDGKTYCAVRLAEAFARMGERTVLCDLNLRHPSVAQEYGVTDQTGLASLLQEKTLTQAQVMSVVSNTSIQGLDLLTAGNCSSAHPADLLAHKSLHQVMACLREAYDIVILDSPTIGKYSDVLIDGLADITCFICRSGKTSKSSVEELERMKDEDRLPVPCVLLA